MKTEKVRIENLKPGDRVLDEGGDVDEIALVYVQLEYKGGGMNAAYVGVELNRIVSED